MNRKKSPSSHGVVAVLTGDIIGSTELSSDRLRQVRKLVAKEAYRFRQKRVGAVRGEPEFFRGDAWQLLLVEPRWALRVTLLIRAALRAELDVDTRVSIGIGGANTISKSRTSLSTGEAFALSGIALDNMTSYFDMTGAVPDRAGALVQWLPVTLHLCSGLVRTWTRRQAEIVHCALLFEKPTHQRIANSLRPKVTKQTVTDSLHGASWRILQEPIKVFEETDWLTVVGPRAATKRRTG